jgi:hypothetical protein
MRNPTMTMYGERAARRFDRLLRRQAIIPLFRSHEEPTP